MLSTPSADGSNDDVLLRVGQMTRSLHESLRGLGFDELAARATCDIPDARDRLDYVARMTEQAAQRVLNATEAAAPIQERLHAAASSLSADWQSTLQQPFSEARYQALAQQTLAYLQTSCDASTQTRQHLMDIMMAQDFQDLTGQVIKKVTELAHGLEQQLLQLLVDYAPADSKREMNTGLLNGPQIKPTGIDVVADQTQVDDLLDSLGF
jgi:chemotaxis protein CheZ